MPQFPIVVWTSERYPKSGHDFDKSGPDFFQDKCLQNHSKSYHNLDKSGHNFSLFRPSNFESIINNYHLININGKIYTLRVVLTLVYINITNKRNNHRLQKINQEYKTYTKRYRKQQTKSRTAEEHVMLKSLNPLNVFLYI